MISCVRSGWTLSVVQSKATPGSKSIRTSTDKQVYVEVRTSNHGTGKNYCGVGKTKPRFTQKVTLQHVLREIRWRRAMSTTQESILKLCLLHDDKTLSNGEFDESCHGVYRHFCHQSSPICFNCPVCDAQASCDFLGLESFSNQL